MAKTSTGITILFLFVLASCKTYLDAPKYQFSNGYYHVKFPGSRSTKVYMENEGDSVAIYLLKKRGNKFEINQNARRILTLKEIREDSLFKSSLFIHNSYDLDFLTVLAKYRPPSEGFPRQFTANLNGQLYLGFRKDFYSVNYQKLIRGDYKRSVSHQAVSLGGFTGIGTTAMNPWVTNNQIGIEYDGMIWSKGFALILAIEKITIGVNLGWDHLLDPNHSYWIYQGKPWTGISLGLNIN
jgi:hypothetical protein